MEEETKLETPEEKAHRKERERFMRQAITQAKKAEKLMEVPIGCVIVYEGKVIARGYNRRNTDKNTLSFPHIVNCSAVSFSTLFTSMRCV